MKQEKHLQKRCLPYRINPQKNRNLYPSVIVFLSASALPNVQYSFCPPKLKTAVQIPVKDSFYKTAYKLSSVVSPSATPAATCLQFTVPCVFTLLF